DVNKRDAEKKTALMLASLHNHEDVVRYLISRGADVNALDHRLNTSLMLVAEVGNDIIANLLVRNRANINAKNIYGDSALHAACNENHLEIVKLLIEYGAD
ncbi:ankyrin repeat protein, partial [Neocallimastix californiae]